MQNDLTSREVVCLDVRSKMPRSTKRVQRPLECVISVVEDDVALDCPYVAVKIRRNDGSEAGFVVEMLTAEGDPVDHVKVASVAESVERAIRVLWDGARR